MQSLAERGRREGTEPNIIVGAIVLIGGLGLLLDSILNSGDTLYVVAAALNIVSGSLLIRSGIARRKDG